MENKMNVKIDKFGRIVLPKKIRDDFGLSAGSSLKVLEEGNRIILEAENPADLIREKKGVYVFTGEADGDLENAVKTMRKERNDDLSKGIEK